MIEALKALIVIGTLSLCAFIYARMAFSGVVGAAVVDRWRNIYLAATAAAFLIPNYWVMLGALSLIAVLMGVAEKFKPALYILLLFAVPAASAIVPGFGGIQNFLALYPFNILAVVILFPLLLMPQEARGHRGVGSLADFFFIAFSLLALALAFRDTTVTDGFRRATAYILTAFAPYLVFSRVNWTLDRLKLATLAYVVPFVALGAIAVVEVVLNWHVFRNAVDSWNIGFFSRYLARSGYLRAYGSVFGPISFGLFTVIAIALTPAIIASSTQKFLPRLAYLPLAAGLLATFSRGPWVGAALAIAAYAATSARPIQNLIRLGALGIAAFAGLAATPIGDQLIDMLPFIGDVEENTIDYRQRLFDVGWTVVMQNPWFGSEDYLETEAMQSLVQGQGIIDIVNAYLQVALDKGLVGLALFVGVSLFALLSLYRSIGAARRIDPELASYCQSWFAALVSVMLVLATTTNVVAQIAEVHWLLCGMCVGIARSVAVLNAAPAMTPAAEPAPPAMADLQPDPVDPGPPAGSLPPHLRQYAKRDM
ncbi:MAG: O-antigen ligase family protein [Pseudomonadota bacterium]